jgi:hypothetical protein
MRMKRLAILYLPVLLVLCTTLVSCEKSEGEGGTSTIKGKVIVHNFDAGYQAPSPREIYGGADEKVYIIYGGDKTTYDDDFDTSFDGSYEFKHLQKGTYKIFVYSKDSSGASVGLPSEHDIPVFATVEITSNGSTVEVPDLIILDNNAQ